MTRFDRLKYEGKWFLRPRAVFSLRTLYLYHFNSAKFYYLMFLDGKFFRQGETKEYDKYPTLFDTKSDAIKAGNEMAFDVKDKC